MKQFRLTRKVQIVLATIFVMAVGIIVVGNLSNNESMAVSAGDKCPDCMTGTLINTFDNSGHGIQCDNKYCGSWYSKTSHSLRAEGGYVSNKNGTHTALMSCTGCSYEYESTSNCSEGAWYYKANNVHYKYCSFCGYYMRQGNCYDENGDGVCDAGCGNTEMHVHSYSSSYINNGNGTHTQRYTCSCGDSYDESKVSCTYGEYTNNGSTHTRTCTVCGYVNTKEHTLITISGKEATCTENGLSDGKKCAACGAITVEQETIPALGHAEVIDEAVSATCTTTGLTEGKHCSRCNEVLIEQETIPVTGHNYENGVCTVCGATDPNYAPEIEITSEKYDVEDIYISKIQPETTIEELKNNLETNATQITIYNQNDEQIEDTERLGTGMKVELKNGNATKTFTIIVRGDVDGDGTAGMQDVSIINRYRLNKRTLEEIYLKAADVVEDGKVDFFDIVRINRFRLHKETEL